MKNKILAFFKRNPAKSIKPRDLAKQLNVINDYEYQSLKAVLHSMEKENILQRVGKRYCLAAKAEKRTTGKIAVTESGYGFLSREGSEKDIFISAKNLSTALNGDTVEVSLFVKQKGKNIEGQVVKVLKRNRAEITGVIDKSKQVFFLRPDDKNLHVDIVIPAECLHGAKCGDKAVVEMLEWDNPKKNPEGKVIEVLGKAGQFDTEIASLAKEFDLPYLFPKSVIREAKQIPHGIPAGEIQKRLDLRDKNIFTIDPDDAKDFDDAVSVETLENGNYLIGVHIADVSHYVEKDGAIDAEALKRGNSVYLVGKVIPMLPEELSTDICSLVPNEDRLTYSIIAELNPNMTIVSYEIKKTIINSKRRFTYDEAQNILDKKEGDFASELLLLNKIAKKLKAKRVRKGSINFITPEIKFILGDNGIPIGIDRKIMKESNNLVEEMMLMANQIAAKHLTFPKGKPGVPFVYRVHALPDEKKLREFAGFVKSLGYRFDVGASNKSQALQKLLDEVGNTEESAVINEIAIRTMAKAVYDTENIGHYGLGFRYYTHFTSPIRRYPDLIVHRILFEYIESERKICYPLNELEDICGHTSLTERSATSAERMSVKLKQMEYLKEHVGDEFHGIISGVTNFGIFIELTQTLSEGLIRMRDLDDDYYEFDEKKYALTGRRTRKRYRLGDKVFVRLIRVDPVRREVDFVIAE